MRSYELAQAAYAAYVDQAGGVSLVSGATLPSWDALSAAIQDAWWSAANAVEQVVAAR